MLVEYYTKYWANIGHNCPKRPIGNAIHYDNIQPILLANIGPTLADNFWRHRVRRYLGIFSLRMRRNHYLGASGQKSDPVNLSDDLDYL